MAKRSPTDATPQPADWPLRALPWQEQSWSRLQQAAGQDSLVHALLLSGDPGIGKTHFGRALAALLLCRQTTPQGACGDCKSCHLVHIGSHSDLLLLQPEEDSRVIKVDQVRSLIDFANQTAALGKRKVILISPAEALNQNAANALLKCLEEPTAGTYLILVSHAGSSLPATIRSRCQLLNMPAPAEEQTRRWLDQQTGDAGVTSELLAITGNRPVAALALLQADQLQHQQTLQQGLDALIGGGVSAVDFPALVKDLDLADVLGLLAARLQVAIKTATQRKASGLHQHFLLLDELLRLRLAVRRGGNPNRQLTIENSAGQLAQVLGAGQ